MKRPGKQREATVMEGLEVPAPEPAQPPGATVRTRPLLLTGAALLALLLGFGALMASRPPPRPAAPADAGAPARPGDGDAAAAALERSALRAAPAAPAPVPAPAVLPPPPDPLAEFAARERLRRAEMRRAEREAALGAPLGVYAAPPEAPPSDAPSAPRLFALAPGTVIRGVLENALDSAAGGIARGRVTETVYDSAAGRRILVPAGSLLTGRAAGAPAGRLAVRWEALTRPDGETLPLPEGLEAADPAGRTGLPGRTAAHLPRRVAAALLLGALGARPARSPAAAWPGAGWPGGTVPEEFRRELFPAPTVTVAAGAPFSAILAAPLALPAYRPGSRP